MGSAITYRIEGGSLLLLKLSHGQSILAEPGAMAFKDAKIEMKIEMIGGIARGVQRMISGERLFVARFTNVGGGQRVLGIAPPFPGTIIPIKLDEHNHVLLQKRAFLCSTDDVMLSLAFTKRISAGLFGGEGFILQKAAGSGVVFAHAGGDSIRINLQSGQHLDVDAGSLVGFSDSVDYKITLIKNVKAALFGSEGLVLARLVGPGAVWIQSMPFSRFAEEILLALREPIDEAVRKRVKVRA